MIKTWYMMQLESFLQNFPKQIVDFWVIGAYTIGAGSDSLRSRVAELTFKQSVRLPATAAAYMAVFLLYGGFDEFIHIFR